MVAYTIANLAADGVDVGTSAAHNQSYKMPYLMEVKLDFVAITAARVAAGRTALANGDTLQVFNIPAKSLVLAVGVDCTTLESTASTVIDIGFTGGDVDAWVDGFLPATVNSKVGLGALMTTAAATNYFESADTLDVLMLTGVQDTSIMRIWAIVMDCS